MRRRGAAVFVLLAVITAGPVTHAADGVESERLFLKDLPDLREPQMDDPVSEAELQDLESLASQKGMSLQAAIDRYAWNDNFAIAVSAIREASPEAFAAAEIVNDGRAWVAFAAGAPESALNVIEMFGKTHVGVTVEVRADTGFTEVELEKAIESVHYAVLESKGVRDATTSFDLNRREIMTVVALDSGVADSAIDDARTSATDALISSGLGRLQDGIAVSIVQSSVPVLGRTDDNAFHIGGENVGCTTGFVVITPALIKGVGTAGHCSDPLTDDGVALAFQADHEGAHGDFQWNRGPQGEPDDFYSGSAVATEVNRRDVAGIGAPVAGQPLCKNGSAGFRDCQDVVKFPVCNGAACNLVLMEDRLATGGDSGGPVYWNYTAYGFHQGAIFDPFPPFLADTFSRADRIDNALGVNVAK